MDLQKLTADRLKQIGDDFQKACKKFNTAESEVEAAVNQKDVQPATSLALEAKQEAKVVE